MYIYWIFETLREFLTRIVLCNFFRNFSPSRIVCSASSRRDRALSNIFFMFSYSVMVSEAVISDLCTIKRRFKILNIYAIFFLHSVALDTVINI